MPTYGTEARVEALVGDVVDARDFDTNTTPTDVQVQAWIDDVEAELEAQLEQQGYTVPVIVGDSPRGHALLVAVASYGAAALVLVSLPAIAILIPGEQPASGRLEFFQKKVMDLLDMIDRQEFPAARATGLAARFYAGSEEDRSTGETKQPIFTRGMTDFPGSVTRQTSS